jgi:hypothetical protein
MEAPAEGKNVNIEIRPTYVQRATKRNDIASADDRQFGIVVNVDINNQQLSADLTKAQINDVLVFASDYVSDELMKFLNNEY